MDIRVKEIGKRLDDFFDRGQDASIYSGSADSWEKRLLVAGLGQSGKTTRVSTKKIFGIESGNWLPRAGVADEKAVLVAKVVTGKERGGGGPTTTRGPGG